MAIGGVGSLTGAMIAGLAVGLLQAMAGFYGFGGIASAIPWLLVIVALLVRPRELAGPARL